MVQMGYRESSQEDVNECVAKPNNRKAEAAGADERVNQFMKHGGGVFTTMVTLYNRIWKNEYAPKR